jgi:hypothetical protein
MEEWNGKLNRMRWDGEREAAETPAGLLHQLLNIFPAADGKLFFASPLPANADLIFILQTLPSALLSCIPTK